MASAYQAVMDKVMGINEVARHSKVSKGSLVSRVHDRMPLNAHVGKSTVLTESEEMELAKCIKVLADWGWGFTKSEVKTIVAEFVSHLDPSRTVLFKMNHPGRDWLEGFLNRHPDIVLRTTEQMSTARLRAQDPDVLIHWFSLLEKILSELGVKDNPGQLTF